MATPAPADARPGDRLWHLLCRHAGGPPRPSRPTTALAPLRRLLRALGNPQRRVAALHIAGSKGKGSTAAFCDQVLRADGRRPGLFVSPHLFDWRERFRIDGADADEALLAETAAVLDSALARLPGPPPAFFDLATAAALWLFEQAGVQRAVFEAGIGGGCDATRLVRAAACCITSIELEHTDRLGSDLAAIAAAKAGIARTGVPLVLGPVAAEADAVIAARALRVGAPLVRVERALDLPQLCPHAGINAALALETLRQAGWLAPQRLDRDRGTVLAATALPGRCELLRPDPPVLVDCAHTPDSTRALDRVLRTLAPRRRLVLSMKPDKNLPAILGHLLAADCELILTRADPERSAAPAELARHLPAGIRPRLIDDPVAALACAARGQAADQVLCAAGSVYLAGLARVYWSR